jgi:glycerol-3-phosphate cytidylyltransferase
MSIIGYTTGVFDLFHVGHLNVLKRARDQCDLLIVGVTTDDLCQQRKGTKPYINLAERMEIVSNIKGVYSVVPQHTMDKMEAWRLHSFNRMFVGDDWKGTDVWNKLEFEFNEINVEIIYFPYTASTSSTKLRLLIDGEILNKVK